MDVLLSYNDGIALLKVEGTITSVNSSLFQEKLDEVQKSEAVKLEIDFSECNNINSMGIGKILTFHKEFASKNKQVEIVKCTLQIYELFMTIKLDSLIPIKL